ncbi:MAG: glycosyltransferase family 4 protein [Planctomycetota bacterium]|nr:glycosyltransferase family 4 protein [Planctomycetota bacterium]
MRDSPKPRTLLHAAPSWGEGGREIRAVQLMGMLGPDFRHVLFAHDGCYDALRQASGEVAWDPLELDLSGGALARLRSMRRQLRAIRPDALLTYNWGSVEWLMSARLSGCRAVVHHEDGFGPDETERRLPRRNLARRFLLRAARDVIVPSRGLETIARREWGCGARVRYLPNGVDVARFHPADGERRYADETVFVCVGALRPEKNQVLAVEALAQAACRERARLVLVGGGPDESMIRSRVAALGLGARVTFHGKVQDTAPCYRDAQVFVIPSNTEQMPLSLLEAMASGLPVIGTDVGDVRAMLAEPNRELLVRTGDAAGLAGLMDRVAADASLRAELGAANRARAASEFDKEACYGRYCDLYRAASARA